MWIDRNGFYDKENGRCRGAMRINYFTEEAYNELFDHIDSNQTFYEQEAVWVPKYFESKYEGKSYFRESSIEYPDFILVNTNNKTEDDYNNTVTLFDALGKILTPKQACNKYMWAYLSHVTFWDYMKKRWPAKKSAIKTRYFCNESRIPLSLNALSRLWWYGYLSYDSNNIQNPYHLTKTLTANTDLCQNLVQSKLSMNKEIILGVLLAIERYIKDNNAFTEEKERGLIHYLNRYGGVTVVDLLDRYEICQLSLDYLDMTE